MANLLSIGSSALTAANVGLRVTGHNIANVSTTGYTRQVAVLSTPVPQFMGSGWMGRGVEVETVRRVYDGFLTAQAHLATARSGEALARADQLSLVDGILGSTDSGLPLALANFQSALSAASNYPADLSARAAALSAAEALAGQFNDIADRLAQQRRAVETQVRTSLGTVNQALANVANLNAQVALAQGSGQPPNDLLDQRDALVRTLSESIGVTAVSQDDGSISLFVGTGQAVVLGGTASSLELAPDPFDPSRPIIGVRQGGTFMALDPSQLSGGSLAGLLKFAGEDLAQVEDAVGRLALAAASAYNERHRIGVDAAGISGRDLFAFDAPATQEHSGNAGTGVIGATVTDATALAASPYRVDWNGAQYTITRLADDTKSTFATLPQTVDGIAFTMAGAPAAGDSFLVNAVRGVAGSLGAAITRPNDLALALPVAVTVGAGNLGAAKSTAFTVPSPGTNANLGQPVTITFTGAGTFDVAGTGTGNPLGVAYTPGQPISYNGWSLTLEGTPRAGDTFTISPSTAWTGDSGNGLALGALGRALLVDGLTLDEGIAGLYGQVGMMASSRAAAAQAQEAVRVDTLGAEQSVSGVNLDEEAARLLQYQQAYQAAAKIIATAQLVFDTLLDLGP